MLGRSGWSLRGCLLASSVVLSAAVAHADTFPYTVQPGDTCDGIAAKVLGDKGRYEEIHDANPELGPPPHHLRPGQILRMPKPGPAATVTHIHQDVETSTPTPHKAKQDEPLMRGHRVSTQADSAAEVTFTDETRLQLGEHTLVVILGGTSSKVAGRRTSTDTTLLKGSLRAHLGELAGGGKPMPIDTPAGLVGVGAGEVKINVDEAATTRLAVYRGQSSLSAVGTQVKVPAGFGSKADLGKAPTPPRPLPAAPAWSSAMPPLVLARAILSSAPSPGTSSSGRPPAPTETVDGVDAGATYAVGKGSGPAAAKWHVQIARDDRFNDLIVNTEVPADVTSLEAHKLLPGLYYARVSAIDSDKFEGPFSMVTTTRVAVAHVTEGTADVLGTVSTEPGLACALDDGKLAPMIAPLPISPGRPHRFRCALVGGAATAVMETTLALPPQMGAMLDVRPDLGPPVGTPDGTERLVTLRIHDSKGNGVTTARVIATPADGISFGAIEPLEGGSYAVMVGWRRGLPSTTLHFVINGIQEVEVPIGNVESDKAPPAGARSATSAGGTAATGGATSATATTEEAEAPDHLWRGAIGMGGVRASTAYGTGYTGFAELGFHVAYHDLAFRESLRVGYERYSTGTFPGVCTVQGGCAREASLLADVVTLGIPLIVELAPSRRIVPYVGVIPMVIFDWSHEDLATNPGGNEGTSAPTSQTFNSKHTTGAIDVQVGVDVHVGKTTSLFAEAAYRSVQTREFISGPASFRGPTIAVGIRF